MKCWREPSLEDILSDPITQAVISADGVDEGRTGRDVAPGRAQAAVGSAPRHAAAWAMKAMSFGWSPDTAKSFRSQPVSIISQTGGTLTAEFSLA